MNIVKRVIDPTRVAVIDLVVDKIAIIYFFFQTLFRKEVSIYTIKGANFLVRKNTADVYIVNEIYKSNTYDSKSTGTVFDIGANIGAFSVWASKYADRVYSFEPDSSNYDLLQKNIELNDCTNVVPIQFAIGSETQKIKLYKGKFNKGTSSLVKKTTSEYEVVEMKTIQEVMDFYQIDKVNLLKIDIEGGEYDILENATKEVFNKIDSIILEYHFVPEKSKNDIQKILKDAGYDVKIKSHIYFIGTGILSAQKINHS